MKKLYAFFICSIISSATSSLWCAEMSSAQPSDSDSDSDDPSNIVKSIKKHCGVIPFCTDRLEKLITKELQKREIQQWNGVRYEQATTNGELAHDLRSEFCKRKSSPLLRMLDKLASLKQIVALEQIAKSLESKNSNNTE